jgi:hypothetical protein
VPFLDGDRRDVGRSRAVDGVDQLRPTLPNGGMPSAKVNGSGTAVATASGAGGA